MDDRHVDCAQYYANEDRKSAVPSQSPLSTNPTSLLSLLRLNDNPVVGEASQKSSIPRSSLFLTTKTFFSPSYKSSSDILPSLIESVKKMSPGMENPYVDLFLIHAPTCGKEGRQMLWDAFMEVGPASFFF
jgi:aryl-alcohol dehydrogenase-like predicted oxidoreductase